MLTLHVSKVSRVRSLAESRGTRFQPLWGGRLLMPHRVHGLRRQGPARNRVGLHHDVALAGLPLNEAGWWGRRGGCVSKCLACTPLPRKGRLEAVLEHNDERWR